MLVKAIIIIFLGVILFSLGSALYYLVRERDEERVVEALLGVLVCHWCCLLFI